MTRNEHRREIVFTVELTALFLILVMVTLIITQVFVMCRSRSIEAARLNASVMLASNAAEICSATPSEAELDKRLEALDSDNELTVRVSREYLDGGRYASDIIEVYEEGKTDEPVYRLETGTYFREEAES